VVKSTRSTDDKESLRVQDKSEATYFLPIRVDQRFLLKKDVKKIALRYLSEDEMKAGADLKFCVVMNHKHILEKHRY
jgi:hypothetical protein